MTQPGQKHGSHVTGVYAALITPVDQKGRPDKARLIQLIDLVLPTGIDGICLGGGTAEYPHFGLEQRKEIVSIAARQLGGRVPFLASIGAPTVRGVLELGEHALKLGSRALLLPMPYFYRYGQEDLAAYVREIARSLAAPCLLYNLAVFTNPLEPETALELLRNEPHLVGMKDSSGDRTALSRISEGKGDADWSLLCGSDGRAFDALRADWNGIISGIASCCPELLVALYGHFRAGRISEAKRCQRLLDELVETVARLPFPWSIRVAAEVRGIPTGPLPLPPAPERRKEITRQRAFYENWFARHLPLLCEPDVEEKAAR